VKSEGFVDGRDGSFGKRVVGGFGRIVGVSNC
jgi:hypothetical protein